MLIELVFIETEGGKLKKRKEMTRIRKADLKITPLIYGEYQGQEAAQKTYAEMYMSTAGTSNCTKTLKRRVHQASNNELLEEWCWTDDLSLEGSQVQEYVSSKCPAIQTMVQEMQERYESTSDQWLRDYVMTRKQAFASGVDHTHEATGAWKDEIKGFEDFSLWPKGMNEVSCDEKGLYISLREIRENHPCSRRTVIEKITAFAREQNQAFFNQKPWNEVTGSEARNKARQFFINPQSAVTVYGMDAHISAFIHASQQLTIGVEYASEDHAEQHTHTTFGHEGYVMDRETDEVDKDNIAELRRTMIYGYGYYHWRDNLIENYERVMGKKHLWEGSKRVIEPSAELVCLLKRARGKIGVTFVDEKLPYSITRRIYNGGNTEEGVQAVLAPFGRKNHNSKINNNVDESQGYVLFFGGSWESSLNWLGHSFPCEKSVSRV